MLVQRDKRAKSSVVVWYRRCKKRADEREMDRMKNEVNLPVLVSSGGGVPSLSSETVCCDVSGRGRDQRSTGNGSFLGGMYFFFIESKFSLLFPHNYMKMRRRRPSGLIHLMLPSLPPFSGRPVTSLKK